MPKSRPGQTDANGKTIVDSYSSDELHLKRITEDARDTPQYEQLMQYLGMRRAIPPQRFAYIANKGQFEYNNPELPQTGQVTLSRGVDSTTLVHELTHAAQRQLEQQYYERPTSWGKPDTPTQFTDAFSKLYRGDHDYNPTYDNFFELLARKLDPTWYEKNLDYRTRRKDLQAFAVGNQAPPKGYIKETEAPKHFEPTGATMFMMLVDQAIKEMKDRPQSQGR